VLVSASEHEGFCVPLLEGLHFGVPVVARACGAVPETLADGGLLYQGRDPLLLAELIHTAVSSDRLKIQLKLRSEAVLQRFSSGRSLGILRSALQQVNGNQ
jgi:L-malate glycosyltransferase